jgi:LmbE family N-acetylglucosaminyl deacetylase
MRIRQLADVEPHDALFIAPHVDDVPVACAARLAAERARGARVLLVVVCGDTSSALPGSGWPATLERWGVDLLPLGLATAAERDGAYASFETVHFGRCAVDDDALEDLGQRFDELRRLCSARDVFLPLALGAHADHRLTLEAALPVFRPGVGRNVFLYEERPTILLPAALRLRLAQLGAWLPPGSPELEDAGLVRLLLRFQQQAYLTCSPAPWRTRVQATGALTRAWRQARAWRPAKGLGVRVQPVVQTTPEALLAPVHEALAEWARRQPTGALSLERWAELAGAYARQLAGPQALYAERYWLVLPTRDESALLARTPAQGRAAS